MVYHQFIILYSMVLICVVSIATSVFNDSGMLILCSLILL